MSGKTFRANDELLKLVEAHGEYGESIADTILRLINPIIRIQMKKQEKEFEDEVTGSKKTLQRIRNRMARGSER